MRRARLRGQRPARSARPIATRRSSVLTLGLWLPDAASAIRTRPEYAIRFVNTGVWDSPAGHNHLTTLLSVSTSATPNTGTPEATFVQQ
jgi:hypothetical protein